MSDENRATVEEQGGGWFPLGTAFAMVEEAPEAAEFLREQRRELRLGELDEVKRVWLDEHMPGWDSVSLDRALGV